MTKLYVRLRNYGMSNGQDVDFATTDSNKAFAYEIPDVWNSKETREASWDDEVYIYENEELVDKYVFQPNHMWWTNYEKPDVSPPIPVNILVQETSCPPETATPTSPVSTALTLRTST